MIITKLDMIVLDMIVHDIGHKPADAMRRAVVAREEKTGRGDSRLCGDWNEEPEAGARALT
jgi:hypothetical protein